MTNKTGKKESRIPEEKVKPASDQSHQNFGMSTTVFDEMVERLKSGDETLFEQIFLAHFEDSMRYLMNRYKVDHTQAYDASMDALLKFRQRLLLGKITYGNMRFLFTRMAGQFLSDANKKQSLSLNEMIANKEEEEGIDEEILDHLDKAWNQLGEGCQKILDQFYYQKITLKILADQIGKSEAAIRKRKQRCLEKLRSYFLKKV